jgi:hypothetical protein
MAEPQGRNTRLGDDALVSAAEIARIAGVTRAAVTNWRKRYPDFPKPVGGERNPLFALSDVRAWLDRQGKGVDVSDEVRLWQALRDGYGADMLSGVNDMAAHLTGQRVTPLDDNIQVALSDAIATSSPAEVVAGLVDRYINASGRAGSDAISASRLGRAVRHFAGEASGTVFDPACGIGSLLLSFGPHVALVGQDLNPTAASLAVSRARLDGHPDFRAEVGDSLRQDRWPNLQAELVVSDPPMNVSDWGRDELAGDARWAFGTPTRAEGELAWLQHCFAHVAPGGRAIVVMPASAAHRKAGRRIRAEIVRQGVLAQVVALPSGTAASHSLPVHLWILTRPVRGEMGVPTVRMVDLTANDPDGPLEPKPHQVGNVPLIDILDDTVDLTPGFYVEATSTNPWDQYVEAREALLRLRDLADLLPALKQGTGHLDQPLLTVGELARDGLVELVNGRANSATDAIDNDYLNGLLQSAGNLRRATSTSGVFRADVRGARIPKMSIDAQREYGAAFRAIEEFEEQATQFAELAMRAAALARDGLTRGFAKPPPSTSGHSSDDNIDIATWTHLWAAAATYTCKGLEKVWDNEAPAASVGMRDALSMALVEAIRNVYRGAVVVCGSESEAVRAFEARFPRLKKLRDRLEHFDEYVTGKGRAQAPRQKSKACDESGSDSAGPKGIDIAASEGGGPDGHVVVVEVIERSGPVIYRFASRAATDAARALAWGTVVAAGLDDERHKACLVCIPAP